MTTIPEVRRAIADRIVGLDGEINVFAYPPRDYPLPVVVVVPASDTYAEFHGTFGALALQTVYLIVRVMVPEAGSSQSASERLDEYLSSSSESSSSLADLITGAQVPIGDSIADIYASTAEGWLHGELQQSSQVTPVVSCDIPVVVRFARS